MRDVLGAIGQVGYVVEDLTEAARRWHAATGLGPWRITEHVPLDHFTYEGQRSDVDIGIASAYSGTLQVELITQHNEAPSMYRELLDAYGEGVQHVCFYPADYERAMAHAADAGLRVGQEGAIHGIRFAYLRGPDGLVVELADIPDELRAAQKELAEAAAGWDGTDPIRIR